MYKQYFVIFIDVIIFLNLKSIVQSRRWPKQRHIHEIHQQHGCTIIPIGYHNPIDRNRIMLIEWQYQFVRAEQILLRSLGHQQVSLNCSPSIFRPTNNVNIK